MVLRNANAVCSVPYQPALPYHSLRLLNSMTSETVIGAWPTENSLMVCGTLSSRTRKYLRPICGTKLFLLSNTATSTVTRLESVENVAAGGPEFSLGFGVSFDGILGRSPDAGAAAGAVGLVAEGAGELESGDAAGSAALRGRATVSLPTGSGPSCAAKPTRNPAKAVTTMIIFFMTMLPTGRVRPRAASSIVYG